jgi:hypothetical protein
MIDPNESGEFFFPSWYSNIKLTKFLVAPACTTVVQQHINPTSFITDAILILLFKLNELLSYVFYTVFKLFNLILI